MTLPRFFSRIHDSIAPVVKSSIAIENHLAAQHIVLKASKDLEKDPIQLTGFMLLVNLCSRLYPKLSVICSPRVQQEAAQVAKKINPLCEITDSPNGGTVSLAWATGDTVNSEIQVAASGWNVFVNTPDIDIQPTNVLASLAAGALGAGELFRWVFRTHLGIDAGQFTSGVLNVLTLDQLTSRDLPNLPSNIDVGRVHLVGAGAIGQAVVYTLARINPQGTLVVTDPEDLSVSNLQRYVLAFDADVGEKKTVLTTRAMRGSRMKVESIASAWDIDGVSEVDTVCTAVDSESLRIAIQAALPRRIYNAWTQPADVGWSRHEAFGTEPCLACLYWPTRQRPSLHELISSVLREHELRVLAYLSSKIAVDNPLKIEQLPKIANQPLPDNAMEWTSRSLLDDFADRLGLEIAERDEWRGRQLADLYREGICGGAIVSTHIGPVPQDVIVPMAHQSALAGIMLASALVIASSAELIGYRPIRPEARLNLLASLPQVAVRPRQRTPACICHDPDFVSRSYEKWGGPA